MKTPEFIRTDDARFADLPGYDFAPRYIEDLPGFEGLRLHYLDLAPAKPAAQMQTFLCLHGEPSWAYLYRRMIPVFLEAGHRVVAPDFFGFGRSDKPVKEAVYTFGFHRTMLLRFIARLDLQNVSLTVQDWGGLLGLTLPMEFPDRIRRLLVMNTTLATGEAAPSEGFKAWRDFVASTPDLDIAALMKRASPILSDAEAAAYAAPFPNAASKAGVRRFPALVMTEPGMEGADLSRAARDFLLRDWTGQSFMAIGMQDPVLGPPVMRALARTIRGCPPPMEVAEAGHFVQEWGGPIAEAAVAAFG